MFHEGNQSRFLQSTLNFATHFQCLGDPYCPSQAAYEQLWDHVKFFDKNDSYDQSKERLLSNRPMPPHACRSLQQKHLNAFHSIQRVWHSLTSRKHSVVSKCGSSYSLLFALVSHYFRELSLFDFAQPLRLLVFMLSFTTENSSSKSSMNL